ncbi:MAG: tyrosine-type recombinase/integrase [Candidatus Phlomobacter fragariae]
MPRIRSRKNRDLPSNLYERKGYYTYRDPRTRKEYGLGRNKAYAINEAINANQLLINKENTKSLTEKIEGHGSISFHEFLDRYKEILKTRGLKEKTLKDYKHRISVIKKRIIDAPIENITTKNIADFLHPFIHEGKTTTAKLLRGSLIDCFREALASGLMQLNPADLTKNPKTKIQRSRLSLNDFVAILNLIDDDNYWLTKAMNLALVTGQRISDIAKLKWENIHDNKLWIVQQKTETKIAIPLDIGIESIKLKNILKKINHEADFIITKNKKQVTAVKISASFTKFRNKTKLTWEGSPPSFHEIRSLSARLYTEKMGSEFTRKLLGHKSAKMTAKYQDNRNDSWIEIENL